jgi:superfamily II DNA or RNA helicase
VSRVSSWRWRPSSQRILRRLPRAQSLDELSEGRLDVICAVDVFNEGLDLPELDTVLMLRPTES